MLKEAESTPAARGFVEAAVGRFNRQLHAFLRRRVRDAAEVDDLAQEVYLRLLRIADIDVVRSPLSYVYGVAAHVASEFNMRDRKARVMFDSAVVDAGLDHEDGRQDGSDAEGGAQMEWEVNAALRQLSSKHLAVLLLERREGLSHAQIAEQLGLSIHTVKKYSVQALAQVRASFER